MSSEPEVTRRKVLDAIELFERVIDGDPLLASAVFSIEGESVPLSLMIDPAAWLGPLMLRCDELATVSLGGRIWDAVYCFDDDSIERLSVRDAAEVADLSDVARASYDRTPLIADAHIPDGLREHYAALAIGRTLALSQPAPGRAPQVRMHPLRGYYDVPESPPNGHILPYPGPLNARRSELNDFLRMARPAVAAALEPAAARSPAPGGRE
ncbi:hypothetical protein J2T57_001339 [Natronocella acetinitrilica]|uniref:Uncharacterized protein n=1 Tax=Natronocella acetinitrilica TaxID=414046 RepID=A0AAE3G2J1_9GAMM|nr:hypothetical protein [Natronocella acetinitrilica]MCP1674237.1 hypothetical protein [Natronocella acetinitrilica]